MSEPDEFSGRWERFWKRTLWVYLGILQADGSWPDPPSTPREWVRDVVLPAAFVLGVLLLLRYLF